MFHVRRSHRSQEFIIKQVPFLLAAEREPIQLWPCVKVGILPQNLKLGSSKEEHHVDQSGRVCSVFSKDEHLSSILFPSHYTACYRMADLVVSEIGLHSGLSYTYCMHRRARIPACRLRESVGSWHVAAEESQLPTDSLFKCCFHPTAGF